MDWGGNEAWRPVWFPGKEKRQVVAAAQAASVSQCTLIRTAVWRLAEGIRGKTIKSLTKCKKIGQVELAKKCKEENFDGTKPGKLKALREAHTKAWWEAEESGKERDRQLYEERVLWMDANPESFEVLQLQQARQRA